MEVPNFLRIVLVEIEDKVEFHEENFVFHFSSFEYNGVIFFKVRFWYCEVFATKAIQFRWAPALSVLRSLEK